MVSASSTERRSESTLARERLERLAGGPLAEKLRASHARRHPGRSADEVADAFQDAHAQALTLRRALDDRALYAWLWRAMDHLLIDRHRRAAREAPRPGDAEVFVRAVDERDDPQAGLEKAEQELELERLFSSLAEELAPRQRSVLALHSRGARRAQVARELATSERVVKRELERILARARELLVERCQPGCEAGTRLVWRFAFGLASGADAAQAQLHLIGCAECQAFYERLGWWREAAAAAVPAPATSEVDPVVVERGLHTLADSASTLRRQLADTIDGARNHVSDSAAQLKAQAATTYTRAIDPTPLAGLRPGATVAALTTCLAIGGSAYCIENDISPIGGLTDMVTPAQTQPTPDPPPQEAEHQPESANPLPTVTPPVTAPATPEPAPPATTVTPPPAAAPVETAPEVPPPPPEQEQFDPAAAAAAQQDPPATSQPSAQPQSQQPAPSNNDSVGEFLGGP